MQRKIPVTSIKMLGKTIPVRQLKVEKGDDGTPCQGSFDAHVIRLSAEKYTASQMLRTLAHESGHAFVLFSGLRDGLCGDDLKLEEMLVSGIEEHLFPIYRAIARLEAGLEPDAEDKRVLGLARKKETPNEG